MSRITGFPLWAATAVLLVGCTSVQSRVRGEIVVERSNGDAGEVATESFTYEAIQPHSTAGTAVACFLSWWLYGGACWGYLAAPYDEDDLAAVSAAQRDIVDMGCDAYSFRPPERAGYSSRPREVRLSDSQGQSVSVEAVTAACGAARHRKQADAAERDRTLCAERLSLIEQKARRRAAELTSSSEKDVTSTCSPSCEATKAPQRTCTATAGRREVKCVALPNSPFECEETQASKELQASIDRLALETTCAKETIDVVSQAGWRAGTETAFRLRACGAEYVCTVAVGRVACRSALGGATPASPQAP